MGLQEILLSPILWTVVGICVAFAAAVYLYAAKIEVKNFKLEHLPTIKVPITTASEKTPVAASPASTPGAAGNTHVDGSRTIKVLHLSDLHLCHPESYKLDFLEKLAGEDYDMVVVTGDIFENESGLQYAKNVVARKPRLGSYAVLGNHDYYAYNWLNKTYGRLDRKHRHPAKKRDVQPFVDALTDAGITTLRNESATLPEANIHIIGIDYPGTTKQVVDNLASAAPPGSLLLALMHLPRRLQQVVDAGVHFAFAGHTHGGQIRLPGIGALITDSELPREEASGLVRRESTIIHVSRGLSADPKTNFRLFCPPAATVLHINY